MDALVPAFASRFSLASTGGEVKLDEEGEALQLAAGPVNLVLSSDSDVGPGTLQISTKRVIWTSSAPSFSAAPVAGAPAAPVSLVLRYQQIVMHAISRDGSAFARPCIYLQLDDGSEDMGEQDEGEEEDGQPQALEAEVRLVPEDPAKVDDIFKALCDCAALNPDEEVEGEGEFFFDEDEVMRGLDDEERAALLARQAGNMELEEGRQELGELIGEDPGRFEDDEEEEEEEEQGEEGAAAGNGHMHTGH